MSADPESVRVMAEAGQSGYQAGTEINAALVDGLALARLMQAMPEDAGWSVEWFSGQRMWAVLCIDLPGHYPRPTFAAACDAARAALADIIA